MLLFIYISISLLIILFFLLNELILNKLNETNKIRIWWEKNICSSKDLEI
jgi:hypothetical protein